MKSISKVIEYLAKIQIYREHLDIPARAHMKLKSVTRKFISKNSNNQMHKSDSENLEYSRYVKEISQNKRKLEKFRKPYRYRQILEHVNWVYGIMYIERFLALGGAKEELMMLPAKDRVGKPRKYFFPKYGWLSTTQIRYLTVRQELYSIFDFDKIEKIGEIGCGFGGQFLVLSESQSLKNYTFYDLVDVQKIVQYYLSHFSFSTNVTYPDITEFNSADYDLVISNYAFSELPKMIQLEYIDKILVTSTRGYIIMNSGMSNLTNRNEGKLTFNEIKALLPWIETLQEVPLTGPDNYVIYWDRSRGQK